MEIQKSEIIHPASKMEDIALTATLPSEMVESQQQLIRWCEMKVAICQQEVNELWDAAERAKKMKWKFKPLLSLHAGAVKKLLYYDKVRAALVEGYYIVPNFPIQMFAVRTNRDKPVRMYEWKNWGDKQQDAQQLPVGDGVYQNPFPIVERHTKDGENDNSWSYASEWDEMEFPITMAKPHIMDVTSRAMAQKIFDRIGVMPPTKKEDPVIIGQIFRKHGGVEKIVSFMIAWHLDTRMI